MSDEEKTEEVERNLGMGMGRLRDRAAKRRQAWEDCFPMTVAKLEYGDTPVFSPDRTCKTGQMVCVRPVPTIDPQERTFIGFYLGDLGELIIWR